MVTKPIILDGPMVFRANLQTVVRVGLYSEIARRAGFNIPPFSVVHTGLVLYPRVLHSEWIVDCPYCTGAEYWWPDEGLFLCCNCWNQAYGHKWLRVSPVVQRKQVEGALKARPDRMNRNWFFKPWRDFKPETVTDLKRENRERGLPEEAQ